MNLLYHALDHHKIIYFYIILAEECFLISLS